jgi:lysophospholipase L1-like esterase
MKTIVRKSTAVLLLAALAACSGTSGNANGGAPGGTLPMAQRAGVKKPSAQTRYLSNIVGVGDSLTAGYQSQGFLGALGVPNPDDPGMTIPPGQESGFWSDLYEQATGTIPDVMYNPGLSPLPLIAGPGLDNQVVRSATTVVGVSKSGNSCSFDNGFDQSAFALSNLNRVRLNAPSTRVRDLGVPGITLHEATYMTKPLTPTCESLPGTSGLLSAVVNGESGVFYPVLGGFNSQLPSNLNMVAAAHSLNPSLVTVWLGANDVLKFMGSGGQFRGGDATAAQTEADLKPIVSGFLKDNAAVAVANLPDVLLTPYFMNTEIPANPAQCKIQQYLYCFLMQFGQPASVAAAATKRMNTLYGLAPANGKCVPGSTTAPCGYVTLQGALIIVQALTVPLTKVDQIPSLNPAGPGSGLGNHYITPEFAGQIQVINDNINDGIAVTAQSTGAAFVDVKSIFEGIASGDPKNPYFQLAQVNPGVCCSLVFLGGLVSFDGLHPSNTGYALISVAFINAINKRYSTGIPLTPIEKIYAGKKPYKFMDPYAPQIVHDLEYVPSGKSYKIRYLVPRSFE